MSEPTAGVEARLLSQRWPTTAGPRDCCLVSPETAHEHGHPLDDAEIAGLDDARAARALDRRARST